MYSNYLSFPLNFVRRQENNPWKNMDNFIMKFGMRNINYRWAITLSVGLGKEYLIIFIFHQSVRFLLYYLVDFHTFDFYLVCTCNMTLLLIYSYITVRWTNNEHGIYRNWYLHCYNISVCHYIPGNIEVTFYFIMPQRCNCRAFSPWVQKIVRSTSGRA